MHIKYLHHISTQVNNLKLINSILKILMKCGEYKIYNLIILVVPKESN
jgi:hypothetical protein